MELDPVGILISRYDSISSLANQYVDSRCSCNDCGVTDLQRESTTCIRQHIRPSVLAFPIVDRCAVTLKTLLLWFQHWFQKSKIRLIVGRLVLVAQSLLHASFPWPSNEFLTTESASSRQSNTKATRNCALILVKSVHLMVVHLAVSSAFPISTTLTLGPIQRVFPNGELTREPRHKHVRPCLPPFQHFSSCPAQDVWCPDLLDVDNTSASVRRLDNHLCERFSC